MTNNRNARVNRLLELAKREAKQIQRDAPSQATPLLNLDALATFFCQADEIHYGKGDPNRDHSKRMLAMRTFVDFSLKDIASHGMCMAEKWKEKYRDSAWYNEWIGILSNEERLERALLSPDQEATRQRISCLLIMGMLDDLDVLAIKRSGRFNASKNDLKNLPRARLVASESKE